MSATDNSTPIYVQDKALAGNGNTYTGNTTRKQRRAMGMAGATYDAANSFNENSAGAKYLKEKGLMTDDGIDMSSRHNRRLLARAQRKDRRQSMRDDFLTQTLGQTYQYGKVVKPEVKEKAPAVGTENTVTTKWSMPQTTLTVPTAPQNLFQMAHPATQATNTTTPINVASNTGATVATNRYTFGNMPSMSWKNRGQLVIDRFKDNDIWGKIDTDGDKTISQEEIMKWQGDNGLVADGKIGYNTFTKMFGNNANYDDLNWITKPKSKQAAAATNTSGQTNNTSGNAASATTSNTNQQGGQ